MLIKKFNYHSLSRVSKNGKRYYATPSGHLPSVTTILDRTKPEESRRALNEWKKRVGTEKAQQITTEAANRGTRMHTYLEQYVKTGSMPAAGTNPYGWASHEMARSVIEQGLKERVSEFWGVEIPLYFPNLYAGTSDGAGIHLGEESILDYKQSNKAKKREWIDDYFLQTVFYGTAHNEVYGTKIRKGVILMCVKPELDQQFNIIKPPIYQEFIIEGSEWDKYEKLMWQRLELYYLMS